MQTPGEPHHALLDRLKVKAANQELFDLCDGVLTDLINQATWVYSRCFHIAQKDPIGLTPILLFRHSIEHADAAHILVVEGASVPAKTHLRSLLEVNFELRFLLEREVEERTAAFLVCAYQDELKYFDSLLRPVIGGRGFSRGANSPEGIRAEIAKFEEFLRSPRLADANDHYKKFRNSNRGRRPSWFQLVDPSINTRRDLAARVGYGGRYELFSLYSQVVHSGSVLHHFDHDTDRGQAGIRFLRDGLGVDDVLNGVAVLLGELGELLLNNYRPEEAADYRKWLSESIIPRSRLNVRRTYGEKTRSHP